MSPTERSPPIRGAWTCIPRPLLRHTQAPDRHRAQQHLDPWQEVATWREKPGGQQHAAVQGEPARCGTEHREVRAAFPKEMVLRAASARPQRSEAPRHGAGLLGYAATTDPGTATVAPARHGRALEAAGSFPPALLPCPGHRAPTPPGPLPASSQRRAIAVSCPKLRFPQAALAAGCAPPRPRRILRSPCRPAAISDRQGRNLPKTRDGNSRTCVCLEEKKAEVFVTFRTRPEVGAEEVVGSALRGPRRRPIAGDC